MGSEIFQKPHFPGNFTSQVAFYFFKFRSMRFSCTQVGNVTVSQFASLFQPNALLLMSQKSLGGQGKEGKVEKGVVRKQSGRYIPQ